MACLRPQKNVKLSIFTGRSRAVTAKKCAEKRDARAKCCFANRGPSLPRTNLQRKENKKEKYLFYQLYCQPFVIVYVTDLLMLSCLYF